MHRLKKTAALTFIFCLQSGQAASLNNKELTLLTPTHGRAIYTHLLENHWISQTGLFASFPDSQDSTLAQQSSTYEQAAIGLLALQVHDQDRADGLLQFFKKAWDAEPHGFPNFYNAYFGGAGIEKTVHAGANAWVGLFAARFANDKNNQDALNLALNIGYWMSNSLPHKNGAIAMSVADTPHGAPWTRIYSTENNISYYAFLSELIKNPNLDAAQRRRFTAERSTIENWLLNTAFDRSAYRMRRGEIPSGHDAKHALDTVTWFISAMGCKRLAERGIDPARLLDTAAHDFEVNLDGHLGVDPADQMEADQTYAQDHELAQEAKRPANDRHRMIWYEGLGQYLLALSAVAQYSADKGDAAQARALEEKIHQLQKAFDHAALKRVKNQAAYPYATPGRFFTDGWRTPAPSKQGPASSLIAGVWRIFAGIGIDPMSGAALKNVANVQFTVPEHLHLVQHPTPVFHGTSDDMTTHAWTALNQGHWDDAIAQAQATIQEWSEWAKKLQARKAHDIAGGFLPYNGAASERQAIFNYWALNDVGACYFILGKAYDEKRDYANAANAFGQLITNFGLAQIWDPKGWFWSPVEAVNSDFIQRDPAHYAGL